MKAEKDSPEQEKNLEPVSLGLGGVSSAHQVLVLLPVAFAIIFLVTSYISWDPIWQGLIGGGTITPTGAF